jgi:hypothetical protein
VRGLPNLSLQLEGLRIPVLLHGDSGPFIPVVVMAELKSRLADARLLRDRRL